MHPNGGALKFDLSKVIKHFCETKKKKFESFTEEDCKIRSDDNRAKLSGETREA